jgi:RNA polymerase sigma-70 factor (ECF subfamily)
MEETPLSEERDGVLAVAAGLGSLDAFSELVKRYRRAAVRIAMGIVGPDAAEDVAQEALLLAYKALPDLDEPQHFAAWLSAITRNRALRWIKREHRAVHVEFDDALLSSLEKIASHDSRWRSAASELQEGIDQLPDSCRLLMRLRWLDEMPMQKIAAFTGLPLSTVKWRLHEGKKKLREWSGREPGKERIKNQREQFKWNEKEKVSAIGKFVDC